MPLNQIVTGSALAKKAASLEGPYARLTAGRKQQVDDQTALKSEKRDIPKLESSVKKQAELLKSAEQQVSNAKEEFKTAAPLIQKVRSLDQRLADQKKIVTEDKEICKEDKARIDATKKVRYKEQEKRTDAKKELSLADGYLKEHAQDEWLIRGLAGVEEQLSSLLSRQKAITQKEDDQEKAAASFETGSTTTR